MHESMSMYIIVFMIFLKKIYRKCKDSFLIHQLLRIIDYNQRYAMLSEIVVPKMFD